MINPFSNVDSNITIDIDTDKIEALVREIAKQHYPSHNVTDVHFDVVNEWQGYGQSEHQVPKFNGIKVTLVKRVE